MNIIHNPPQEDVRKYGLLAHVEHGERLRVLETMNAQGLRRYCEEIEQRLEFMRRNRI